jgi:hypothetical protein
MTRSVSTGSTVSTIVCVKPERKKKPAKTVLARLSFAGPASLVWS